MIAALNTTRVRRANLLVVVALALVALPSQVFPIEWIAAFLAPAALILPLLERTRVGRRRALVIALIAQVLSVIVVRSVLPLTALAALGCTLIPPAIYSAMRAGPVDSVRAIFLGFCILIVGAILGNPAGSVILAFLAAAVVGLSIDVWASGQERKVSWRGRAAPTLRSVGTTLQVAGGALLVCLLVFRGLAALPDPVRAQPDASTPGDAAGRRPNGRTAGPARDFEFDGTAGSPLSLRADQLLTVYSEDGHPVPSDLYLRSGAFEIAGLDRWREAKWRMEPMRDDVVVGRAFRELPERRVRVVAEVPTDLAFVPAGTFELIGARLLRGSPARGTFRHGFAAIGATFEARFHNLHYAEFEALPDPRSDSLLQIPPEVERERAVFAWILDDSRVRHAVEPLRVAEAVAEVIRSRCRYALLEPTGPHRHAVLDFLDGDHRGFCMHFASAEALALRMLGVPCRIGVGVYGGDELGSTPNTRTYGSQHAHAWVEIPIENTGWVVVDPTPPSVREFLRWPDFAPRDGIDDSPAATELDPPDESRALDQAIDPGWLAGIAGIMLLFSLGFRRVGEPRDATPRESVTNDVRDARRLMARVLTAHARVGRPRTRGESLETWSSRVGAGDPVLRAAIEAFQEVRFGGRPLDAARRGTLEAASEISADHVE